MTVSARLQRFCQRPGHAAVLRRALPQVPMTAAARDGFEALLP